MDRIIAGDNMSEVAIRAASGAETVLSWTDYDGDFLDAQDHIYRDLDASIGCLLRLPGRES
jgi:hypothetical protein